MSQPAPYASDTSDLLTRSLSHLAYAAVVMPDGERYALNLRGGRVTFDENTAPRASAQVECKVPDDDALLGRMDPRTGARLVIEAGYRRPDGLDDVQALVNLGLRSRRIQRPADTFTLEGLGDEALVIDKGPAVGASITGATTAAAITANIQNALPAAVVTVTGTPGPAVVAEAYDDIWDRIQDLSDRASLRVFDDGTGAWRIEDVPGIAIVKHELSVGPTGTITASDAGLSRDDDTGAGEWANMVILVHKWTPAGAVESVISSRRRIQSGPYAAVSPNIKAIRIDRTSAITQANADLAAAALVARTVTRGRSFQCSAVAAYWLRPGMTVQVTLPAGEPEKHLVTRVSFDLATGRMDVTTRLPDNTGTIGA
jgi:hypothetical protein